LAPSRFERLREGLEERGCRAAILVGPRCAIQFAGYSRYLGGLAAVVFEEGSRRTLVVPRCELSAAEETAAADEIVGYGSSDFLDPDPRAALFRACLERVSSGRVGLAGDTAELADALDELVLVDELVLDVRLVKDDDEIARLASSYELALTAQRAVAELVAGGVSEIELCAAAHARAQTTAGAPIEFISVVASGPHTAAVSSPVHVAGRRCVAEGDPLLADLAVRARGYWGDTTRTSVCGENPEVEDVVAGIAAIQQEVRALLRPGIAASAVFEETRAAILTRFPEGAFPHHAGHGIGIDVAESPDLAPTEAMLLREGMVLAIEPGVYFAGRFGVRVEDMVVVTAEGASPLPTASEGAAAMRRLV
jgi:Xaa-Pro aminopeptidase